MVKRNVHVLMSFTQPYSELALTNEYPCFPASFPTILNETSIHFEPRDSRNQKLQAVSQLSCKCFRSQVPRMFVLEYSISGHKLQVPYRPKKNLRRDFVFKHYLSLPYAAQNCRIKTTNEVK